jgi:hypothetical protein
VRDPSLFSVTKRAIAPINQMEAATAVCGFMSARTQINIVASFRNAGIVRVVDEGVSVSSLCQTYPDRPRCLRQTLDTCLNLDIRDEDSETAIEANLYMEECVDVMISPRESEPESKNSV